MPLSMNFIPATTTLSPGTVAIEICLPPSYERTIDAPDPIEFTNLSPAEYRATEAGRLQKTEIIVRRTYLLEDRLCKCLAERGSNSCRKGTCYVGMIKKGDPIDVSVLIGKETQVAPESWEHLCGVEVEIVGPRNKVPPTRTRKIYLMNPA